MPTKPIKTKLLEGYIEQVNINTDVCAFICPATDMAAFRAAFNRKKKSGQRLSFRVQGGTAYGIIAREADDE